MYHEDRYLEQLSGDYKTEDEYRDAVYKAWCKEEFGTSNQGLINFFLITLAVPCVIISYTYHVLSQISEVVFGESGKDA